MGTKYSQRLRKQFLCSKLFIPACQYLSHCSCCSCCYCYCRSKESNIKILQVEGEAQGEEEKIDRLVKELGIGPRLAKVARVERWDVDVKVEGDVEVEFEVK